MNKILPFLLLSLPILLTLLPLARPGLFDVHDPTSVIRFYTLSETLRAGQFPAAWTNLLNQGYGYPLFLYYAPIFGYLGVLIKTIVSTYILSLKFALAILTIIGGWGMYRLLAQTNRYAALVASAAYTLLPYHAGSLYVRGSYAELATMAALPWLLHFWQKPQTPKLTIITTATITSLFFLSHNTLPLIFLPALLIWIILWQRSSWRGTLLSLAMNLGLISWFYFPVIFERGLVQVDSIATTTKLSDHALAFRQLWHSPWGYGGSAAGIAADGMSFMLGKFQLVLAAISAVYLTLRRHWSQSAAFFVGLLVIYSFLTLDLSIPLWDLFPALSVVQFPWRSLAFATFGLAGLSGLFVQFIPKKFQFGCTLLAVGCLLFFNLKFFVPQSYVGYRDADLLSQEKLDTVARNKIPEYLPAQMPSFPPTSFSDGLIHTPIDVSGTLLLHEPGPVVIGTAFMPQWGLSVDGQRSPISPSADGKIQTTDSFSPGHHQLQLAWHRTLVERIGIWITSGTLLLMVGWWVWRKS